MKKVLIVTLFLCLAVGFSVLADGDHFHDHVYVSDYFESTATQHVFTEACTCGHTNPGTPESHTAYLTFHHYIMFGDDPVWCRDVVHECQKTIDEDICGRQVIVDTLQHTFNSNSICTNCGYDPYS